MSVVGSLGDLLDTVYLPKEREGIACMLAKIIGGAWMICDMFEIHNATLD